MTDQPVSLIVVSRHRPTALMRCIVALTQQDHTNFELIVVADPEAAARVAAAAQTAQQTVCVTGYDEANISAARNLGLALAAGSVVAFIDDDAVAEPTWLSRLTAPFANPDVVASTGFVRGRNGISYQWQACEVDALAQDHPLTVTTETLRTTTPQRAVKTQGTNCAFRRDTLLAIGGFDPNFRFFLDEADVNLRMAGQGATAIVPNAQVHHGYQASARRTADRIPLSLFEIAASTACFLRRHAEKTDFLAAWSRLLHRESARLLGLLQAGKISARQQDDLLKSLAEGWADGLLRPLSALAPIPPASREHLPLPRTGPRPGIVLSGRFWQRRRLLARARVLVAQGQIVTVFCLSPTARPHWHSFEPGGVWLQTGGIFGRSDRIGPRVRLISFRKRIAEESARLAPFRPISGNL